MDRSFRFLPTHHAPILEVKMRSPVLALVSILAMAAVVALPAQKTAVRSALTLTSADVHAGKEIAVAQVFNGMGCTGKNVSPALSWSNVPAGTKSLALTVYDPDAPTGSGWWHWVVYNIPATAAGLPSGAGSTNPQAMPAGAVQGTTDFGTAGYGGPCPPAGPAHHYIFTLYALKVSKIDVPATATAAMVGFNLHANMIAKASITALYGTK